MNQAKIYDVAGAAGVSLATVSRVLNHPEKVKKSTRDRVLKIIKEKGYKPNANARGLASRRSTTIAIVVPKVSRSSIAEMIQGIDDSAKKYGYNIRLFINTNHQNEQELWSEVIASSVDGILFLNDEMDKNIYALIENTPVPVIFINAVSQNGNFGSVGINDKECAYNITKKMIEKGNKKIMFIGTGHKYTVNEMKEEGYLSAMKEAGLEEDIIYSSGDIAINEIQFKELLSNRCPEVVLAVRDSIAVSFMNLAVKKGIKVPEELQVIGFQNTKYAELANPKLTCVETPIYEIGNKAMGHLTELMKFSEEKIKAKSIVVDYQIIWRESTK